MFCVRWGSVIHQSQPLGLPLPRPPQTQLELRYEKLGLDPVGFAKARSASRELVSASLVCGTSLSYHRTSEIVMGLCLRGSADPVLEHCEQASWEFTTLTTDRLYRSSSVAGLKRKLNLQVVLDLTLTRSLSALSIIVEACFGSQPGNAKIEVWNFFLIRSRPSEFNMSSVQPG